MKKTLISLIVLFLTLSVFGCSKKLNNENGKKEENKESENMENISFSTKYFEGKKVAFYGDSITFGATVKNQKNLWVNVLKETLHYTYKNFAINGALLSYKTSVSADRSSMAKEIYENADYNKTADYAIILCGTNDFARKVSIGSNDSFPNSYLQVNTYKEGIIYAFNTLKEQNPNIKIIFLLPIDRFDISMSRADGVTLDDFRNAIIELSNVLGYYYVDSSKAFNQTNFKKESLYSDDALHPNDEGHKYFASYLLQQKIMH